MQSDDELDSTRRAAAAAARCSLYLRSSNCLEQVAPRTI